MKATDYYTYAYLDEHKKPYYIGKGRGRRAEAKHASVKVPSKENILILKKGVNRKGCIKT